MSGPIGYDSDQVQHNVVLLTEVPEEIPPSATISEVEGNRSEDTSAEFTRTSSSAPISWPPRSSGSDRGWRNTPERFRTRSPRCKSGTRWGPTRRNRPCR